MPYKHFSIYTTYKTILIFLFISVYKKFQEMLNKPFIGHTVSKFKDLHENNSKLGWRGKRHTRNQW